MKAIDLINLLDVEDGDEIAYGYTGDRETVSVRRSGEDIERVTFLKDGTELTESFDEKGFYPIFGWIKRWYRDSTNEKLADLCELFGESLPLV